MPAEVYLPAITNVTLSWPGSLQLQFQPLPNTCTVYPDPRTHFNTNNTKEKYTQISLMSLGIEKKDTPFPGLGMPSLDL